MTKFIIQYMVDRAKFTAEGTAYFEGSPRYAMEAIGMSNGKVYKDLYELGFIRTGRGKKARWIIPNHIAMVKLGG